MEYPVDYSPTVAVLIEAERKFTARFGSGSGCKAWEASLEKAIEDFNHRTGSNFDPIEARHRYIEQQEK